jgi:hypothetical protein
MLDVVKIDGRARGIIARDLVTGKIERFLLTLLLLLQVVTETHFSFLPMP